MNLPYQLFIAFRYFRSKKTNRGISLNTLISVGGVALGVTALTTVLSVMGGFHDDLQSKILGVNAHIVVLNYTGKIKDHELLIEKINRIQGVSSSSPVVYGQVMLGFEDRANGVMVRGIEPEIESETTDVLEFIKEGSVEDFIENSSDIPGIAVGRGLSRNLGLFVGDEITMISPVGDIGPMGMLPKMKKFKVAAIFEVGMYEYDSSLALVNMADAQEFFKLDGEVTGIEVKVDNIYNSKEIAEKVESLLGAPHYARDWMEMNRNLFSALELEKYVMFLILVLVILVASFNIISNLIMIVMEKAREIAVIKAMGAAKGGIMLIFMAHGLIIGVIGTAIGLASGYVLCRLLQTYQFIDLPPDVYYLSYLPVRVSMVEFIVVASTAVMISFIATIYPSWQAAKMDPVEALRYE
ncbi:MAG TPA: lipoprotein-releasing ABC transporter permease subunit [Nitrospirae bacterium]|nr:lipoprotein-releasing ABC transporter permease subunit [Nitrospirota bacterium]